MTLGEIKDYTAASLGISDAATKAQAGEFAKARWRMIWNNQSWRQAKCQASVAVAVAQQDVTLPPEFEFVTACRWKGQNELTPISDQAAFSLNPSGYDQTGAVTGFAQIAKDDAGNARLRLFQKPSEAQTLFVLGKRKCVGLAGDTDSPLIPGVSECLCAFTMGDLYRWIRQFTKAQALYEEANALLAKMVEIETAQASEIRRIIPSVQELDGDTGADWLR